MDSFYGGQPGATPVFRDKFGSINEMLSAFQDPNYTQCYYGEYCLIDCSLGDSTSDSSSNDSVSWRNRPEHGNVYKRTYSGAEFMGNIAGPAGALGNITVSSIEDVLSYLYDNADETSKIEEKNVVFPLKDGNTNWDSVESTGNPTTANIQINSDGFDNRNVKVGYFPLSQNPNSGRTAEGISYSWYKTEDDRLGSMVNLGLDIPAPVIDFKAAKATYAAPYDNDGNKRETSAKVRTKFDADNPFCGDVDSNTIGNRPFYFPVELEIYQPPKGIEISELQHAPVKKFEEIQDGVDDGAGQATKTVFKIEVNGEYFEVKKLKEDPNIKSPYNTDGSLNIDTFESLSVDTKNYKEDAEIWYIVVSDYFENILKPKKYYIFAGYYDVLIDMNRGDEKTGNSDYGAVTKIYSARKNEGMNLNTSAFLSKIQQGAPSTSNVPDRNGIVFDENTGIFYGYDWDESRWKEIGGFCSTQISAYTNSSDVLTNKFTRWDSLNNIRPTVNITLKDASATNEETQALNDDDAAV